MTNQYAGEGNRVYEYVNSTYKVGAYPGQRVKMQEKLGVVLLPSFNTQYVHVLFGGEFKESLCHPTWEMTYYGASLPPITETNSEETEDVDL